MSIPLTVPREPTISRPALRRKTFPLCEIEEPRIQELLRTKWDSTPVKLSVAREPV